MAKQREWKFEYRIRCPDEPPRPEALLIRDRIIELIIKSYFAHKERPDK